MHLFLKYYQQISAIILTAIVAQQSPWRMCDRCVSLGCRSFGVPTLPPFLSPVCSTKSPFRFS